MLKPEFDETLQLAEDELRRLAKDSDPVRRLHAIWALGMKLSPVVELLDGEPNPGVRRGLAVVLAGRGEVDLLVALSRHDPNVHVRASTVQIVVRFARAGRIPWSIVMERFADAAEVRAALVSQLDSSTPADVLELALQALHDPEEIVRREAFEVGIALVLSGVADRSRLRAGLESMTRGECSNAIAKWLTADSAAAVAAGLATASRQVRELVIRARPSLAFTELLPLIEHDAELLEKMQHELPGDPPMELLVRRLDIMPWRLLERIRRGDLSADELLPHTATLRAYCLDRLNAIADALAEDEVDDYEVDEYDREWLEDEKRCYEALLDKLDRLVG